MKSYFTLPLKNIFQKGAIREANLFAYRAMFDVRFQCSVYTSSMNLSYHGSTSTKDFAKTILISLFPSPFRSQLRYILARPKYLRGAWNID